MNRCIVWITNNGTTFRTCLNGTLWPEVVTSTSTSTKTSSSTSTSTQTSSSTSTSTQTSSSTSTSTETSSSTQTSTSTVTSSSTSTSTQTSSSTSTSTKTSSSTSTSTSTNTIDITKIGLTNYWSFNGDMYDSAQGVTINPTVLVTYVPDRRGRANSAINFNKNAVKMGASPISANFISTLWWFYQLNQASQSLVIDCYADGLYFNVLSNFGYVLLYEKGVFVLNAGSLPLNVWTHVAIVHDGTNVILYINGVNVNSVAHANPTGTAICCFGYCNPYAPTDPIQAYLDDFRVYNIPLSSTLVNAIMNYYN